MLQPRRLVAVPILSALLLFVLAAAPTPPRTSGQRANSKTPLQALVTAEKAFAQLSVTQGMRTAFLANLADDGVVFRPLAVNGKEAWEARPVTKAVLAWTPAFAEVAGSGDVGFTTGPWEYTPAPDAASKDKSYGTFLSVWRVDRGDWKLVADLGCSHEKSFASLEHVPFAAGPDHSPQDTSAAVIDPRFLDRQMSTNLASLGAQHAFPMWLARDVRYLTEGAEPRIGPDAAAALAATAARSRWVPSGGGIAKSGDLGYTYGIREDSAATASRAPDTTVYLHVWRKTPKEAWKIAAAVENPIRPREK